jgi:hypothetical protein
MGIFAGDFMTYASAIISPEQHARVLAEPVIHTLTTIAAIGIFFCRFYIEFPT